MCFFYFWGCKKIARKVINWIDIKADYISCDISLRDLAKKYDVSFNTLGKKASREKWQQERQQYANTVATKVREKITDKKVREIVKNVATVDDIVKKLIQITNKAVEELDIHQTYDIEKEKRILVDENNAPIEKLIEVKKINQQPGIIKTKELNELTKALKDLDSIQKTNLSEDTIDDEYSELSTEELRELLNG